MTLTSQAFNSKVNAMSKISSLVLAGLLIAVSVGTAKSPADAAAPAGAARAAGQVSYSRRSTRIMRHASGASTGRSASKSP